MELTVTADELFDEYKAQLAQLNHDLILERVKNRKLAEVVQDYQRAEADRSRMQRQKAVVAPQRAVQDVPLPELPKDAPPPPPLPPGPDDGISAGSMSAGT